MKKKRKIERNGESGGRWRDEEREKDRVRERIE